MAGRQSGAFKAPETVRHRDPEGWRLILHQHGNEVERQFLCFGPMVFRKAAKGIDAKSFVAYCKIKDDAALFLLHVPDLRKFEDAAKETMLEGAWTAAQFAAASMPEPRPKRLTVGIRGILSYYGAHSGKVIDLSVLDTLGDRDPTRTQLGIEKTTTDEAKLKKDFLSFFEVPVPSPAPATPAKSSAP